jgi:hypothetical protein
MTDERLSEVRSTNYELRSTGITRIFVSGGNYKFGGVILAHRPHPQPLSKGEGRTAGMADYGTPAAREKQRLDRTL